MKNFIFLLFSLFITSMLYAQNESELLAEGIIFPRMTTSQRIALTPKTGQCIFNIDLNCIECYDSSNNWRSFKFNEIYDADGDTYITTEQTADEDWIRMDVKGQPGLWLHENTKGLLLLEPRYQADNTFFGSGGNGLFAELSTMGNTLLGSASGYLLSTGNDNTGIGRATLSQIGNGSNNVAIGSWAMKIGVGGSNNIAIGFESLQDNTADDNVAMGYKSLNKNTSGIHNTSIGTNSMETNLQGQDNSALGYHTLKGSIGNFNTAMGSETLVSSGSANHNSAFGYQALNMCANGFNSAFGNQALSSNVSGISNTAVGMQSLMNNTGATNTAVGAFSGAQSTIGSGGVFLGYEAGQSETNDDRLHIANNATTSLIYGEFDNEVVRANGELQVRDMDVVDSGDKVIVRKADGTLAERDNLLSVSATGDTLFNGANWVIVPGISAANPILDGDGNAYTSVVIGSQTWLVENLRTTSFNDGTPITYAPANYDWNVVNGGNSPGYCWPNGSSANEIPYGALYNGYTALSAFNGGKNACPVGFHVPTETELDDLGINLGGLNVAGEHVKETGTAHWMTSVATNNSGFTAVGSGLRFHSSGSPYYTDFKYFDFLMSSTSNNSYSIRGKSLNHSSTTFYSGSFLYGDGVTIRCIKD